MDSGNAQYNLFIPLMCVLLTSLTTEVTKVKGFNDKHETGEDRQIIPPSWRQEENDIRVAVKEHNSSSSLEA